MPRPRKQQQEPRMCSQCGAGLVDRACPFCAPLDAAERDEFTQELHHLQSTFCGPDGYE